MVGETFASVMIDQFSRIRDGDPFWSEGSDLPQAEIDALWATTLSDVIERNTDVGILQDDAFLAYDRIGGTSENDILAGGESRDLILGEKGDDRLSGEAGDDQIEGGAGRDVMFGGIGDDILRGGDGRDRLVGGAGDDELEGGPGDDVFVFGKDETGHDLVVDLTRGDRVDLTDFNAFRGFGDLRFTQGEAGLTLVLGLNHSVTFEGLQMADIHPEDFLL